jgi:ATP-dependent DNA helicase RecQ
MQAKIFTLKFDPLLGIFDDAPVQEFLKHRDILSLREHFFVKDDTPYLTLIATYNLPLPAPPGEAPKESDSWRTMLTDGDIPLFNTLRDWRQKKARDAGVPPYIIFNNAQLAAIALKRPHSLNALSLIDGIGRAKLEKYGHELLHMLAAPPAPHPEAPHA